MWRTISAAFEPYFSRRREQSYAHPPALHARLLRAYASARGSHAHCALSSLAGNVDDHHRVAVADLILCLGDRVRAAIEEAIPAVRADRRRAIGDDLSAPDG
jgi:hypothetical protein